MMRYGFYETRLTRRANQGQQSMIVQSGRRGRLRELRFTSPRLRGERAHTPAAFFAITLRKKLALSLGVRTWVSKFT